MSSQGFSKFCFIGWNVVFFFVMLVIWDPSAYLWWLNSFSHVFHRTALQSSALFPLRCATVQLRSSIRPFAQWNLILAHLQHSRSHIVSKSHRTFNACNASPVACAHGCAIACTQNKHFRRCGFGSKVAKFAWSGLSQPMLVNDGSGLLFFMRWSGRWRNRGTGMGLGRPLSSWGAWPSHF